VALPKLSTPLYIGKEEGHRTRWVAWFGHSYCSYHIGVRQEYGYYSIKHFE
jgi:hypothetical protein